MTGFCSTSVYAATLEQFFREGGQPLEFKWYHGNHEPSNITFYSDADWNLRYVFEAWMAHCVDPTSKQPAYANDQHGQILINQLDKGVRKFNHKLSHYDICFSVISCNLDANKNISLLDDNWYNLSEINKGVPKFQFKAVESIS